MAFENVKDFVRCDNPNLETITCQLGSTQENRTKEDDSHQNEAVFGCRGEKRSVRAEAYRLNTVRRNAMD